jgi:pimeloyl-ACP methyl ester carboxylesterase
MTKWLVAVLIWVGLGCESAASQARPAPTNRAETEGAAPLSTPKRSGPVRVELLAGVEPAVFVLRGRDVGPDKLVFLHGMCGHGLGYAQSFQHAAANKGLLIAPQADVVCGDGPWAKWSLDVAALDGRITAAFRALGFSEPIDDICVLGMSQGATRAAALARAFPDRYTRLVSMGAPTAVDTTGLSQLRAAVLMVGSRERKDLMRSSEQALQRKGVPAKSLIIPDADHAGMGPTPEQTMAEALDWLWSNARPAAARGQ